MAQEQIPATQEVNPEVELLKAQNEALSEALVDLTDRLKALEANPGGKSVTVGEAAAPTLPKERPEFTVGGNKYRFTVPTFYIGTDLHTAVDAAKNKTLLATIVAEYGGIVEKA